MSLKQIANVRIGLVNVIFNGVDLGHTLDGVDVEVERNYQDVTVDKYGDTPVDKAVIGNKATVKCKFAEPVVELLQRLLPDGENRTGTYSSRSAFGTDAGTLMRQYAFNLQLHPTKNSSGDLSEDVLFYKAVNTENIKLNFKVKDQEVVEATFECFIDESYGNGRRLGHIGAATIS